MFVGLAEGLPFKVDPIPLSVAGEMVARMQARWTFGWNPGIRQCYYRDEYRMRKTPRPAVFATHKCGAVLLAYVDMPWVVSISTVLKWMQEEKIDNATHDQKHDDALFSLNETLGARVIEEAPF
jgi:hypothetical protein